MHLHETLSDPTVPALFAGFGILAIIIWIVVAVGGFILSAYLMSLYLRLVIRFSRKTLDREYRYMRGDYRSVTVPANQGGNPRNW
jgi:hypothetical protein